MGWIARSMTRIGTRPILGAMVLLPVVGWGVWLLFQLGRAESLFRAAEKASQAGQFPQAREYLDRYLQKHPNSFAAHLFLARVARRAHFLEEAEIQLDICDLLPAPREVLELERILIKVQQGDLSREESLWSQVQADSEQAQMILEALSRCYRKNYLLGKMLQALNAWLERNPQNIPALLQRGWVRERQLNFHAAVDDYRQALQADADNDEARLRHAQALLYLKQPAEAWKDFQRLYQKDPDNPPAGLGLAQCLLKRGQTEEAQQLLDKLTTRFPGEFSILLERGRLALELGQAEQAETWLRKAVALAPHDYQAVYSLSLALHKAGKDDDLARVRESLKQIEADMVLLANLTEQLQKRPQDPQLRCEIGKVFLRAGEKQEGLLWLKSAVQANPQHVASHLALAEYYQQNNQPMLAARHRQLARPSFPGASAAAFP